MSKKGKCFFCLTMSLNSFHCASVGSMPVGLCAHAWSKTIDPSGAALMSAFMPSKSRPTVSLLKYLYCLTSSPESLAMGMWLPQVGVGK